MDEIELVSPSKELRLAALEYKKEHFEHNEKELHGSSLLDVTDSYDDWLDQLERNSDEKRADPNWVVTSTFFAVRRSDGKIVGMVAVRHSLNEFLRTYGGHIGYGVRPTERNKGYAAQILSMALEHCRAIGLREVMVACNKDNEASRRTIVKCGGVLEKEFYHTDGALVQRFWIAL